MFQILGAETWKALETKLTLWCGTDNKVAEERIDLVGLWCCNRSALDHVFNVIGREDSVACTACTVFCVAVCDS